MSSARKTIKTVIFDFGKVLTRDQDPEFVRQMADMVGLDVGNFTRRYFELRHRYDAGLVDTAEYWKILAEGRKIDVAALAELDLRSWNRPNRETFEWFETLANDGVDLAILSNMPKAGKDFYTETFPILSRARVQVFSCDHGINKPEPRIYQILLNFLGTNPEDCLFFDDTLPNIDAARAEKINGIHFTDCATARAETARHFEIIGTKR